MLMCNVKWLHKSFDVDGGIPFIFKQLGWYLNFSTWFMKNEVLLEMGKIQLCSKWHLVSNKMEIMGYVLKMQ
jgi:hypothetical protein